MPIEHTIEFYERVELLRLEKKGDNFVPKLFKKVMDTCLKNCYPNLKPNQIKKYNDKIFFVLVDKKPAKDTHLLNPYGFFTIKVESENDINKVVIYDLCKSFQGKDNDIICRIMLRKFIEHLEKLSFQLNIKESNNENNLLIHEIIIYVSKNKDDKMKIGCYNEAGFKSEDETLIMKNNDEEEEFEKYKLPLPTSKFLEKNDNQQNNNKKSIKYSNSVNKEPEVLTAETISNGNNLGTITGQLEEIINNEKDNMEEQIQEENKQKQAEIEKQNSNLYNNESETEKLNTEETLSENNEVVRNLNNGFTSIQSKEEIEEKNNIEKTTKEEEEAELREKNGSFLGNVTSAITGFMTGSSSAPTANNTEEKQSEQINNSSSTNTLSTNASSEMNTVATNTANVVNNVANNTLQSAQNLFSSENNQNENSKNSQETENISISINDNEQNETKKQEPNQQGGKKKNTKKKGKSGKNKKYNKKRQTKKRTYKMKGG